MLHTADIDVFPVSGETLSPKEFIELAEKSPDLIASTSFELARLGTDGFWKIRVQYTRPRYKNLPQFKPVAR